MNNIKKIGLSALAGSLAMVSANAVDYTVSGGMIATYTTAKAPNLADADGKGLGSATDLAFNASGELDNGFTVDYFMGVNTDTTLTNSSSQMTVGMGSLGTIQYNNKFGSKSNGIDDITPHAYNETWDGLNTGVAGDNPSFFGSSSNGGSVDYRIPAQEYMGLTINASVTYDPQAGVAAASKGAINSGNAGSSTAYTLQLAHESGLELGGGVEDIDDTQGLATSSDTNRVTAYAKYSMGGLTVAYQEAYQDSTNSPGVIGQDLHAELFGIAYTMGNTTVSYAESSIDKHDASTTTSTVDVENESMQIAYVMGAMTISAAMSETSGSGHVADANYDQNTLAVSFAF
ncbi:porin [Candidatus Pelagibacter sp.]|nr:porin [Candidatus Pelagibacter sp.]